MALFTLAVEAGFPITGSRPDIEVLSRFGAAVRYPDPVYTPTEEDGREMAAAATRRFTTVLGLIGV